MPHTHSRYQQDLGFSDGLISFATPEISAFSGTAAVLTRNAVGDYAWVAQSSATTQFAINVLDTLTRRSGFFEDTQNTFGSTFGAGQGGPIAGPSGSPGTGLPASAEPQGRPGSPSLTDGFILPGSPQPVSAMGALQQITPRTAFKIKGIKPLTLNVIYKVVTGAATSINITMVQTTFRNGQTVATGQTTVLANAQNGLINVAQAAPYVTSIPIPNAVYYQISPLTQLWIELVVVEPGANTFQLYGVELGCEFNYN